MKKTIYTVCITAAILFIFFCFLRITHKPEGMTPQEAIAAVRSSLGKTSMETIINPDNPIVEEVIFDTPPSIIYFEDKTNVIGQSIYKITFNTTTDGLSGPLVFYVDKSTGKVIGTGFRF